MNSHWRSDLLVGSEPDWVTKEKKKAVSWRSSKTEGFRLEGRGRRKAELTEHDRVNPVEVGDEQRYREDNEKDVARDD